MLRSSMTDRRRRAWTPSWGRSSFFFRFSASSSNNFRFAFLALKAASQGFTWKILMCSSKINHVLLCSLSGELACGPLFEVLQLTEPKELCAQAWKPELKSSPWPAILLDMQSQISGGHFVRTFSCPSRQEVQDKECSNYPTLEYLRMWKKTEWYKKNRC